LDSQTTLDPLPDTLDAPYSDTLQVSICLSLSRKVIICFSFNYDKFFNFLFGFP
jgi:hypothetical protein